ncbi:hypothetical protein C0993_003883 [Termitomyces sp. T159_Od127]|nr:hypothetical protein C0993_003883 [Termitomyces sp. T159_Od127]
MTQSTITVEPGHRGTVSGVTAARFHQRAIVDIKNSTGRTLALTTLVGRGDNVPLVEEANPASSAWSFGPFGEPVAINVLIEHSENGDNFSPSKVIKPINVSKRADASHPASHHVSTILSEDDVDDDYTDCIVNILQYK